jgi:FKBP-type peptidyl-prolyl cis-trans isomerase
MRNKYIFWSFIGVWVLLLAGGGGFAWHMKQAKAKKVALANVAVTEQATQPDTTANTGGGNASQSVIIPGTGGSSTAPNSQNTTPQVAGANTTNPDASKLLDPTTFSQYDKYKDNTSALYIDLLTGDGTPLSAGHKAGVYYRGWLTNGTLFDQSKAGSDGQTQPFVFTQGEHTVIPGWEQALDGMKAGGVRLVIVPPGVGYGAAGQGPIPGNAVLVFQVQLAAVQ